MKLLLNLLSTEKHHRFAPSTDITSTDPSWVSNTVCLQSHEKPCFFVAETCLRSSKEAIRDIKTLETGLKSDAFVFWNKLRKDGKNIWETIENLNLIK